MVREKLGKFSDSIRKGSSQVVKFSIGRDHRISVFVVIWFSFGYSFGEYYYTIDPALPKWGEQLSKMPDKFPFDLLKASEPINFLGLNIGVRPYHIFPMFLGYYLILSFFPLIDDLTVRLFNNERGLRRREEVKRSLVLGVGNLSFSVVVEDFGWFLWRFWAPLKDDPKGGLLMQTNDFTSSFLGCSPVGSLGFCIPNWYFHWIIIAIATYGVYVYLQRAKARLLAGRLMKR